MLPVISRSQLGISSTNRLPSRSALEHCPLHLLAAIYASALRYVSDDEHLSVWHVQTCPSTDAIWRLVYEELQEDVHQSQLSVVQATLLYLHKDPSDEGRHALSDTPFMWSWTGKLVGLTTSLGIHTECSMWAIPSWEKRLRKRIWWAVYAEDKWRSLLMGRPPYIHPQEWDIEDLDASDFGSSSADKPDDARHLFRNFISLTRIAESVQETFYSLRAAQRLSVDMAASIQAARPLLQQLEAWRSSQVESLPRTNEAFTVETTTPPYSIRFAYHVLVIYVYRALFRPMVQPSTPPHVIDLEEPIELDNTLNFDDFSWDAPGLVNLTPFPAVNKVTDSQVEIVEDVAKAAIECAAGVINLARRLSFSDLSQFWPSCKCAIKQCIPSMLPYIIRRSDNSRVSNWFRRRLQFCRTVGSASPERAARRKGETITGHVEPDSQRAISRLSHGATGRVATQLIQPGWPFGNLLLAFSC
jgi:hypothetical protein